MQSPFGCFYFRDTKKTWEKEGLASLIQSVGEASTKNKCNHPSGVFIFSPPLQKQAFDGRTENKNCHAEAWQLQLFFVGRGDWIRTSDHQHPMLIRYRTALHPENFLLSGKIKD